MRRMILALAASASMAFFTGCRSERRGSTSGPAPSTAHAAIQPTTSAADKQVPDSVVGRWTGTADIVVSWTRQRKLPVQLDVAADGSVTGMVGDATLADAKLAVGRTPVERSLSWGRDWRVRGQLRGDIIAAEQIRRDAVNILFDQQDQDTLAGGLHSSGSKFGDRDSMVLSAGKIVLQR